MVKGKTHVISTSERSLLLASLKEGLRIDGRNYFDFRQIKIHFGEQRGHCEVQLGRTRVLARVFCEVQRPFPDRPSDGFLTFNTEFSPMGSPLFEPGRPSVETVQISRMIEKTLRESRAVDTEGLCIKAEEKVWSVRTDIHILDDQGNITDCASIAAISALLHFRKPEVSFNGEEVIIHSLEEKPPVPLSIHHIPICISFGFFDEGNVIVVDPSLNEEQIMEGEMTIAMNIAREVCALSKPGGTPLIDAQILRCTKIAAVKVNEITALIKQALKEDEEKGLKKDKS